MNDLISKDSSRIRSFIQILPQLTAEKKVFFSNLNDGESRILCSLLNLMIKRISISARRSKQAFTCMWDNLKQCLEAILNDALRLNNRSEELNLLLRHILQLGIAPEVSNEIVSDCVWLAMSLDSSIGTRKYTLSFDLKSLNVKNEDDQKVLHLYCDRFQVDEFLKLFLAIERPSDDLVNLLFSTKYYSTESLSACIHSHTVLPIHLVYNLKTLSTNEWIHFDSDTFLTLIEKLVMSLDKSSSKEQAVVFDVLTSMTESLDFRCYDTTIHDSLNQVIYASNYEIMSDLALSKYWGLVFAMLSSDCIRMKESLESRILFTLEQKEFFKANTAVCRVLSLYWSQIHGKDLVIDRLFGVFGCDTCPDKFKWNAAIALMNLESTNEKHFTIAKNFWLDEMRKMSNFKVIYSLTNLLMKWSLDSEDLTLKTDPLVISTSWTCLNKLKVYINENSKSLECEDGEKLVENARKLETILKSILIGGGGGIN